MSGTNTWSLRRVNSSVSSRSVYFYLVQIANASVIYIGYGATTLPAVTESITLDGDVNSAELEAERVAVLLDKLSENMKV